MNAAARLVHQEAIARPLVYASFLARHQLGVMVLGLMVLLSSLSVIYITHLTRELHATYEQNLIERNQLQVERGQLLLERSTWMVQSRIQQIAEQDLEMVFPNRKSTTVVSE